MTSPILRLYTNFVTSCKDCYLKTPEFYDLQLKEIIDELVAYSGRRYTVMVESPLPAPALAHAPNFIKISPAAVVLERSVVATIMGHEWGHHELGHVKRGHEDSDPMKDEYEADAYSVSFLKYQGYEILPADRYRKMIPCNDPSAPDVQPWLHYDLESQRFR